MRFKEFFQQYILESVVLDEEYLRLAQEPDNNIDKLQKMVDTTAKKVGGREFYHSGNIRGNIIDVNNRERGKISEHRAGTFYGTTSKFVASTYPGKLNRMFAFIHNPFEISTPTRHPALFNGETAIKRGIQKKSSLSVGEAVDRAKANGYDGVIYSNVIDVGRLFIGSFQGDPVASTIIIFKPNQIKLADPVTYDDEGNIIPLSKRFDESKDDIRY
jgi:hypothetical protein